MILWKLSLLTISNQIILFVKVFVIKCKVLFNTKYFLIKKVDPFYISQRGGYPKGTEINTKSVFFIYWYLIDS